MFHSILYHLSHSLITILLSWHYKVTTTTTTTKFGNAKRQRAECEIIKCVNACL